MLSIKFLNRILFDPELKQWSSDRSANDRDQGMECGWNGSRVVGVFRDGVPVLQFFFGQGLAAKSSSEFAADRVFAYLLFCIEFWLLSG